MVAGKVFTHNCDKGKLSALIQCSALPNVGPYTCDSGGIFETLGNDSLLDSKQKSSYKHVS
jgi:hypothetical protein